MSHYHTHLTSTGAEILPDVSGDEVFRAENITLSPEKVKGTSTMLLGVAGVGIAVAVAGAFVSGPAHALAAFHVGACACLAVSLGALFFTMATHMVNGGWISTFRRQWENIAMLAPIFGGLALLTPLLDYFVLHGKLFTWMSHAFEHDYLLDKKRVFFNPVFFFARGVLYVFVWTYLANRMMRNSLEQDRTGDRWLNFRSRQTSAWGLLAGALTLAFAGFDWLMSLDFRFFSTMWGVWFFATAAYSSVPVTVLVLALLRRARKLQGVVTEEHFHDLGKFCLGFTVFWSYISFSQYFLIWYSNIPEETAWYVFRLNTVKPLFIFLCIGHFAVPFLILLFRKVKRSPSLLSVMAVWALVMHVLDFWWVVRPMVAANPERLESPAAHLWIDVAAVVGLAGLFAALLMRRIAASPLLAKRDPRLYEGLVHKNYV